MVLNCRNWVTYSPIGIFGQHVGIYRILVASSFLLTMSLVLFWSNIQIRNARSGLIEPILFPSYVKILYAVSIIDLFTFSFILILEPHLNDYDTMLLYCLAIAAQHTITEGIAFMFLQKGCGIYSKRNSQKFAICWFVISFLSSYFIFMDNDIARYIGWGIWFSIVVCYGLLWLLPAKVLFRRPAGITYARFWFWYRALMFLFYCLILLQPNESSKSSWGYCGVVVIGICGYALCHPFIIYRSLVEDSRWWQGLLSSATTPPPATNHESYRPDGDIQPSVTDVRSPLLGVDFSIHVASALAEALDYMGERNAVKILNFAQIQITSQRRLLGRGSFSKVFRGAYNGLPCAVKLIYTSDLTEEVISRVTTEASILSAASSVNIVKILGIAVLPPSVCMVLELCAYGSLSDVLRGNDSGRVPLALKLRDKIFLALGCARGVAALHALSEKIVHRDIKSFNFLVDSQFNAKLADLELGINTMIIQEDGYEDEDAPTVDDFLVNWVAPEVLRGESFSQQSDIYALSLVLYEIVTGLIPYDDVPAIRMTQRQSIKELVMSGYRPDLSDIDALPSYLDLIERGWSGSISARPSAQDMVEELQNLWTLFIHPVCEELLHASDIAESIYHWFHTPSGKEFIKAMNGTTSRSSTAAAAAEENSIRSLRDSFSASFHASVSVSVGGRNHLLSSSSSLHHPHTYPHPRDWNDELSSVQTILSTNIDWIKIESVPEEMCVVTSISPYLLLKASIALSELFDLSSPQELFGHSLRSLFCSPPSLLPIGSLATARATRAGAGAGETESIEVLEILQQNKIILEQFYLQLGSSSAANTKTCGQRSATATARTLATATTAHHSSSSHHCVLTLISPASSSSSPSSSDLVLTPCVIYAYPIFYHEVIYREYYPGLVSILPDSIGTTFSSEYYEHPSPQPPPPPDLVAYASPSTSVSGSPTRPGRQGPQPPPRPAPTFLPPNGVLYYQLHFNRLEQQVTSPPEEEPALSRANSHNSSTSILGNFTRIFSTTSSIRSGNAFSRTDTTNTSNTLRSHRYLSSSSGGAGSRQGGRISTNSQSTVSIGSHPRTAAAAAAGKEKQQPRGSQEKTEDDEEKGGEGVRHDELKSERSLEFDSLEGGLMLERTNTNGSLRSLNSDSGGWMNKY